MNMHEANSSNEIALVYYSLKLEDKRNFTYTRVCVCTYMAKNVPLFRVNLVVADEFSSLKTKTSNYFWRERMKLLSVWCKTKNKASV